MTMMTMTKNQKRSRKTKKIPQKTIILADRRTYPTIKIRSTSKGHDKTPTSTIMWKLHFPRTAH